ncbi:MAG: c-type cytochrome [Magnetococcales bacterium]|nr:c-type cytochrome [Magnetococcales bacterium]
MNTIKISLLISLLYLPFFTSLSFAGDSFEGKQLTKRLCSGCHRFGPRFKRMNHSLVGPSFKSGIIGKKVGKSPKYKYSKAFLKAASDGYIWDEKNLDKFLSNPSKLFKKNKMSSFKGVKDPEDRANIIAFLKSL